MKLTKKQEKIKNWLLERPGYLKKDAFYLWNKRNPNYNKLEDIEIALKAARKEDYQLNKLVDLALKAKPFSSKEAFTIITDNSNVKGYDEIIKNSKLNKNNVLIIGDTHEPFCKEGYLEHCLKVQKEYNCGTVIHIGDLVDNHAVSYHESDPDGRSPGDEFKMALDNCDKWYKAFPEVLICIGNHDRLPFRKAFTSGLPKNWLKSYQEMFNSPKGWKWDFVHKFNDVIYQHGTGMSGEMASINAARENRQSTVIGHLHTVCNTRFLASNKDLIFGMSVGCGIDHTKYAFAYGKENTRKPVLACAVVLDGKMPINIPMKL